MENQYNKKQTLCWYCENSVPNPKTGAGCPWSIGFKPVPGWEARETKVKMFGGAGTDENPYCKESTSYHVTACPMFKADAEPTTPRNTYPSGFPKGKRALFSAENITDGIYFNTLHDAAQWIIDKHLYGPRGLKHKGDIPMPASIEKQLYRKNEENKTETFFAYRREWRLIKRTAKGELLDED